MHQITALGELLIDFTESGTSAAGMKLFERNPGGAVANVLAAASRLGCSTAFLGKVGEDMHGHFLKETLDNAGIDTSGLVLSDTFFTTLAFVALSESGERTFSFARKPGADTQLRVDELNETLLESTDVFHVGSLSLTDEPARSATHHAVKTAKASGAVISYDPNYRASLWSDVETAKARMRELLPFVDVMKLSDEETSLLTDHPEPEKTAAALNAMGIPCVAVTLGKKGALVSIDGKSTMVASYPPKAMDTTGAGDAFWGGFLTRMLALKKRPNQLTLADAADCADWGNAVATCCVQKRGAIPAMPTEEEVLALMRQYGH
ncbi:MAG: carbohydrate kinase [Firmicutes bacterium HGW-Firmicutes-9]|nr:MAG: carbohydrate kinase [Firmicutes bacterium HGW-Firmicutes-9]